MLHHVHWNVSFADHNAMQMKQILLPESKAVVSDIDVLDRETCFDKKRPR